MLTSRVIPMGFVMLAGLLCNTRAHEIPESAQDETFSFVRYDIDTAYGGNGRPGWVRAGDMDADGDVDIVAGGGNALFVYSKDSSNSDNRIVWRRFGSLDATSKMGANGGVLLDVDGDADLDVVSAAFEGDLGWWENPGGPLRDASSRFHVIAANKGGYLHDIVAADMDRDGTDELLAVIHRGKYFKAVIAIRWLEQTDDVYAPWVSHAVERRRNEGAPHGHAGVDTGDIDADGDTDIAFGNGWYEWVGDASSDWVWHEITDVYGVSSSVLSDIDGDGDLDIVLSAGHHGEGAFWFENTWNEDNENKAHPWVRHNFSSIVGDVTSRHRYSSREPEHLHHPECLAVHDLDLNGDPDVVTCDLFFGEDDGEPGWSDRVHSVDVYANDGSGIRWTKNVISSNAYPSHLLQLVDLNQDDRVDIISEATGYSVVSYLENTTGDSTSLE